MEEDRKTIIDLTFYGYMYLAGLQILYVSTLSKRTHHQLLAATTTTTTTNHTDTTPTRDAGKLWFFQPTKESSILNTS